MSQLALARRYRPHTLQTVIGQELTLRALCNALDQKHLHHAYLFTGMQGVGKTTIARVLAKCLNCEKGISSTPCGTCFACEAIDQGHFVDLIEVDAASRTKVEDTRELLDNVQYLPTRGRFKIYLIDEVHMLSGHSFNALLKTLEEPPAHVKFLLATTDPQKLPVTVLSRCLQFHLWRVPLDKITRHLSDILNQEKVSFEKEALTELGRAANGSLRDALSLLDQALSFCPNHIETTAIRQMLGVTEKERLLSLLSALGNGDAKKILEEINHLENTTPDFSGVLVEFLTLIHQVLIARVVPEALDENMQERDSILKLAKELSPEEIQLYYQIGLQGQRDLPFAPSPRVGFEMILLRMVAFQPVRISNFIHAPIQVAVPEISKKVKNQENHESWNVIVEKLQLTGLTKVLAEHCVMTERNSDFIQLMLDSVQEPLLNKRHEDRLCEALCQYFGRSIRLKITKGQVVSETPAGQHKRLVTEAHEATSQMIEVDSKIQKLIQAFDAKIEHIALKED